MSVGRSLETMGMKSVNVSIALVSELELFGTCSRKEASVILG